MDRVRPFAITNTNVSLAKQVYDYTGKEVIPSVVVSANGKTLKKGHDYTISYTDNIKEGTAKVTVTGKGNYTGTATKTFTIKQTVKKITPAVILSSTSFTYNGRAQKPSVTVKNGSTVLKPSDYSISCPASVNAGTYKVTVTMKGNYSGTAAASYRIVPQKAAPKITLSASSYAYNGKTRTPSVTVKVGTRKLASADYTVTYPKGRRNVGTYKVTVTLKRNYSGKGVAIFKVIPQATKVTAFAPVKKKLAFNVNDPRLKSRACR